MEVRDVVTKRVFEIDADEMMFHYSEHFVQSNYLAEWYDSFKTGNTDELRSFLERLPALSTRFVETALASRMGDPQPMVDFFLESENNCFWSFLEEKLLRAEQDGLEREVVINFTQAEPSFKLVFGENQVRLITDIYLTKR